VQAIIDTTFSADPHARDGSDCEAVSRCGFKILFDPNPQK